MKYLYLIKKNKPTILTIFFLLILDDVLFIKENSDIVIFSILGMYVLLVRFFHLRSKLTFFIALLLLSVMFIFFLTTGTSVATEKAAVWVFFFILIGILQQLRE